MAKLNSFFKIEMLFLKILEEKDCYGYEITQTLSERTNGKITVKEGTMYPILYRLEDSGYISSCSKLVGKRLTRVYYHLEDNGKEYLHQLYHEYNDMQNVIKSFMGEDYEE